MKTVHNMSRQTEFYVSKTCRRRLRHFQHIQLTFLEKVLSFAVKVKLFLCRIMARSVYVSCV